MKKWLEWLDGDDQPLSDTERKMPFRESDSGKTVACTIPNTRRYGRWLALFLGLGLFARVIRYYLCFPLWDDESFLCVNFINHSYLDLLKPLDYHQVAPILFLWIERTAVGLFGFSEYTLRLFPFVCSLASLFLFRRVAERLLSGPSLLFAVALFAVSYPGIRYAAEAKPYCSDMFVSLVMLWLVVEWHQFRDARLLGLLAAMMPLALGVSYPAVFAAGGLSLVVGAGLLMKQGTRREWIGWSAWNIALASSFALWFLSVGRVQNSAESDFMGEYWKVNFPPIAQPSMMPYWLLKTHASDFLAYPVGGPNWASSLTLVMCVVGLWQLARRRQFECLGLVLAPVGLHLIAAAMQRYPYGGHVKFSQYAAPMICCTAAIGIGQFVEWWSKREHFSRTSFSWAAGVLVVVGCASIARDLASPYKTRSDFRARAFAQSFWMGAHSAEEVACIKSDLGLDFVPDQHRELSWSAHYLCNRAIEISRSSLRAANVDHLSATRPLRCVLYRDARYVLDQSALDSWLTEMREHYDLIAHESLPFPRLAKNDRKLITMEYIDSYKFAPRPDSANRLPPLADGRKTSPR